MAIIKIGHLNLGENDLMVQEIRRLENAIHATEVPTMIAKDCLANRQRRIDTDLVQDNTEKKLLQELEIISGIKSTLTEALNNARYGNTGYGVFKKGIQN